MKLTVVRLIITVFMGLLATLKLTIVMVVRESVTGTVRLVRTGAHGHHDHDRL